MFRPIAPLEATLTVFLDGAPFPARAGETIAACLLRAGVSHFRTTSVTGVRRPPYCMIGHCFDCLVEIEGIGSRQACLVPVEQGMRLRTQSGPATIENEAQP